MRENAAPTIVNIARYARTAGVFAIHALRRRRAIDVIASRRTPLKADCADSESRILAIKKFSRSPASRLIGARQNRIFERIGGADSRGGFLLRGRRIGIHGE
ncbi:MAG: hypothetical protein WAV72_13060 [Bradyrhizobium sp.]